jgi:predicted nuclease of predicted toxin-antitoxin system
MEKLFSELYLDEDVDILVADLLIVRGFSVTTTRGEGQLGNTDMEQIEFAVRNQRVLVTHNRADFELIAKNYTDTGKEHFGIILASRRSPHEVVRRLLLILNQVTADEIKNHVRYI